MASVGREQRGVIDAGSVRAGQRGAQNGGGRVVCGGGRFGTNMARELPYLAHVIRAESQELSIIHATNQHICHCAPPVCAVLCKRTLRNSLDWTIRRDVWRGKALDIRAQFEHNRNVTDPRQLAQIFEEAEARLAGWKHPDPYVAPTAPGGTKWERNLPVRLYGPFNQPRISHLSTAPHGKSIRARPTDGFV
ncbi:hypothetical protein C8R43DRAFT_704714 [Mycena crocata]|nr:hypothetical protein C8R43DRAFT_704714 [Mycena crocata]